MMVWVLVPVVLLCIAAVVLVALPRKVPREPDREGFQDAEASAAYDRVSHWPIFALEQRIVLSGLSSRRPEGLLLDIGCGPGYLAARIGSAFPDVRVIGVDINPDMLSIARRNWSERPDGGISFVLGDVEALPIPDDSIDVVVSSLSLHHWRDPVRGLSEIGRVLAPRGRLVLFDLRRDSPRIVFYAFAVGQALFSPLAIRRTNGAVGSIWASYTAGELESMLSEAPFGDAVVRSRPGWLLARAVKSGSRSSPR